MASPLVLISPAMAVPSGFYRPLLDAFEARGWQAQALVSRGFDRDEPRASRTHDWSYGDGIDDIAEAVSKARAEDPERPVIVLGHSLGGQIGAGHELNREPSDGFVGIGTAVPHFRHFGVRALPVLVMGVAVPIATCIKGYVPKPLFGAPGARTLMTEWARFIWTGTPPFPADRPHNTPSLMIYLEGDAYAPRQPFEAYVKKFCNPDVTSRWVYRKSAVPTGATNDHVQWVRHPDPVVNQIVDWWTTGPGMDAA